ncbi:MAG TPA: rhomboid family intramembrane serine protease [Enhygromyxa sp.]|nr:rhomboid family intramembrane serine protease [Enhygromyxa sp.]
MQQLRSSPDPAPQRRGVLAELKVAAKTMAIILAVLWGLEIVDELVFSGVLDLFGVHPRTVFGLIGVVASPFLHGDLYHLLSNTAGLVIFGTVILLWSRKEFAAVTVASMLLGGLGTWLVGASGSIHIGASGVVFGYFGYVLMRGWYERKPLSIIVSIAVAWMFGSLLTGAIPGLAGPGISWEGHLFGMLGGVLVARRFKALRMRSKA